MGQLTDIHADSTSPNVFPIRETLQRKSIEEALYDAWGDLPPKNPHNDPEVLRAEALIANDIFNSYIRPALRIAIGAPHYIEGPEKKVERVAKKKGAMGDNCDWARHSNLLNDMNMVQRATDMLSTRGILNIKGPGGLPLTIYIVDTDNTFIEPSEKKPGLRMINTKFLIPLQLQDGTSTYHVLELRSYLAGSAEAYEQSELAYQKYREQDSLAKAFQVAANSTSDPQAIKRLQIEHKRTSDSASRYLAQRTKINVEDAIENGANALLGYTPQPQNGSMNDTGWEITSFQPYLEKLFLADQAADTALKVEELKMA